MPPPSLDQHLRFLQCVEHFPIKELVAQFRVKALAIAVLPRASRRDVERLHVQPPQPLAQGRGNELRAVVGPYVLGRTMLDEQIRQRFQNQLRVELAVDPDGQALTAVLVDHAQHAIDLAVMGAVLDEVVGPDMPAILRSALDKMGQTQLNWQKLCLSQLIWGQL